METKYYYAAEKFGVAVYSLAIGPGPLKERLADAFTSFVVLAERDLPPDLVDDYKWVRSELTRKPAKQRAVIDGKVVEGVEGRIGATLRSMRVAKAQEIAIRIYNLSHRLDERMRAA